MYKDEKKEDAKKEDAKKEEGKDEKQVSSLPDAIMRKNPKDPVI